jgi:hypothetical protein
MIQVECVVREDMFQGQSDDVGTSGSASATFRNQSPVSRIGFAR